MLRKRPLEREIWADQLSEALSHGNADLHRRATEGANIVMSDSTGRDLAARAYGLLFALLTGALQPLNELLLRFRLLAVICVPRSGGSYLPISQPSCIESSAWCGKQIPNAIAHDSFQKPDPFRWSQVSIAGS